MSVLLTGDCCPPLAAGPLDAAQAGELAPAFKALGDPVRLRLLSLIASAGSKAGGNAGSDAGGAAGGEVCVCELTGAFDLTGATISHHLKVLREAGLVDCERRGTWVYYWPRPEILRRLAALLDTPAPAGTG